MVFVNENTCYLICNCGCGSAIVFRRVPDNNKYIYVGFMSEMFYTRQDGVWDVIKRKLSRKTSELFKISVNEDDMMSLVAFLEWKKLSPGVERILPAELVFHHNHDGFTVSLNGVDRFNSYELTLVEEDRREIVDYVLSVHDRVRGTGRFGAELTTDRVAKFFNNDRCTYIQREWSTPNTGEF